MSSTKSRPDLGLYWCGKCETLLDRSCFHASRSATTGLQGQCKSCTRARQLTKKKGRPPKLAEVLTPEQLKAHKTANRKAWELRNREYLAQKARAWRAQNPEAYAEHKRRTRQKNIKRIIARNQQRLQHVKRATPPWADKRAITDLYTLAKVLSQQSGVAFDVDHQIPLRGKMVCGLHVEANLRLLPRRENQLKANKF